ncbi:MAG: cysteine--tRNA ligase [Pirellulales bacterium]|nr:cysteine--tRNA ligase [Pirellulales bacterium]
MSTAAADSESAEQRFVTPNFQIYNTLSRDKQPFVPATPGKVGIYLCGPTVYDKAHIGHMVGPVIFDAIKRYLTYSGYEVTWVVNITDVDDKLINKANERGISMAEVADENTKDYLRNLAGMGVDGIDHMPKATESMQEIIDLTQSLINKGFAYEAAGDVFFEVGKDSDYGKLTNRTVDDLQGDGGGASAKKRSSADFALWKAAKEGEPSWESPWGQGRPGWHIECSAMSRKILGESFDIHGGGLDLIFPHHENEIAQSECCHGRPMATFWMHNGLLRASQNAGKVGGRTDREQAESEATNKKMSRSDGAGGLAELIARQGGERIRFFLLRTHYRSTVLFSDEAVAEAGQALESFYRFFKRFQRVTGQDFYEIPVVADRQAGKFDPGSCALLQAVAEMRNRFLAAMDDDFNTGSAVGDLFEMVRTLNRYVEEEQLENASERTAARLAALTQGASALRELSSTLGLFLKPLQQKTADSAVLDGVMELVLELRAAARQQKDFATADQIRDAMGPLGIALEDRAGGTDWSRESGSTGDPLDGLMQLLIDLRANARSNKDFATADRIRDALAAAGVALEDRQGGTEWAIDDSSANSSGAART